MQVNGFPALVEFHSLTGSSSTRSIRNVAQTGRWSDPVFQRSDFIITSSTWQGYSELKVGYDALLPNLTRDDLSAVPVFYEIQDGAMLAMIIEIEIRLADGSLFAARLFDSSQIPSEVLSMYGLD